MIPIDDPELPQVTQLANALVAADGVRSASMDPAELTTPAVWLRFTGLDYTLQGAPLQLQLVLVVGDTDGGIRAARALAKLHNAVAGVLQNLPYADPEAPLYINVTGAPTAATAVLSDTPTPLPALVVPITIS